MVIFVIQNKVCSLPTQHTKFSLNKNMPNYNCFHINYFLKETCNILLCVKSSDSILFLLCLLLLSINFTLKVNLFKTFMWKSCLIYLGIVKRPNKLNFINLFELSFNIKFPLLSLDGTGRYDFWSWFLCC